MPFGKASKKYYITISPICQIALLFLFPLLLALALALVLWLDNSFQRGVTWGPELARMPDADVPPLGVNLFLDREPDESKIRRTLELARDMGAHWIKQQFPWDQIEPTAKGDHWDERFGQSTWAHYDRIVALCQEYGLELIVRLDRPPDWARQEALDSSRLQDALREDPDRDITGPPDDLDDWGDFVYAVVSRYRSQIRYIQLWNEPNLANEWNWAPIEPQRFVELLCIGYTRAKEANPDAVVLFPSLAYNDGLDPRHMSDLAFLQAVYEAGGKDCFDVMAAQFYGLGQPPTEHSPLGIDRERLRLLTRTDVSRVVLLREIMEQHGDAEKAVWVGELGWNATPPDWTGRPSIWGRSVDEETKARYIIEALDRSLREWPWMGVRNLWFLRWGGPPPDQDDPTQFFALVSHDFTPLPAYTAVLEWAANGPPLGVGYHDLHGVARAERSFLGTRLDLVLPAVADPASLQVEVNGQPQSLHLWRYEGDEARYVVASGLPDDRHSATLEGPPGVLRGCYVIREQPHPWLFPALTAALSLGLVLAVALLVARLPDALSAAWGAAWRLVERFQHLAERWQALTVLGGMALCLGVIYRPGLLPLSLLALLVLLVLAALRLDLATVAAVLVIPLYAQPATLAGRSFSLFELTILVCLVAAGLHLLRLRFPGSAGIQAPPWRAGRSLCSLRPLLDPAGTALPALAFLLVCTGSLLWSTDRTFVTEQGAGLLHISLREYRVTVVEPLLLYSLLLFTLSGRSEVRGYTGLAQRARSGPETWPQRAWWPPDALVLGGTLVALGGIVQVFTPWMHAEVADGVRRATSVYGTFSANALALFLGRALALALAGALFLPRGGRRRLYLAALPLLGGAFFLTYSRGGYIALALVLLFYGLLHSRTLLWAELGVGAGGVLLAWLTGGIERLLALDTFRNRLTMWQNAWAFVREHPLLGLGLDAFYHHYHRRYPESPEAYWTPHNVVLEFWTRLGLLGLAVAAWIYGTLFVRGVRLYRKSTDPQARALVLALMGSVVYALAHGLLDGTFFAPDWAATFWVAYGLIAFLGVHSDREDRPRETAEISRPVLDNR